MYQKKKLWSFVLRKNFCTKKKAHPSSEAARSPSGDFEPCFSQRDFVHVVFRFLHLASQADEPLALLQLVPRQRQLRCTSPPRLHLRENPQPRHLRDASNLTSSVLLMRPWRSSCLQHSQLDSVENLGRNYFDRDLAPMATARLCRVVQSKGKIAEPLGSTHEGIC